MPFLLPALGIILGACLVFSASLSRPWSRRRLGLGAALILGTMVLVLTRELDYIGVDLNPAIPNWQSLAGTWRRGNTVLTLTPDGRWHCARQSGDHSPCDTYSPSGRWRLEAGTRLVLQDPLGGRPIMMPVITDDGTYRLLTVQNEDPDSWDVARGYERATGITR